MIIFLGYIILIASALLFYFPAIVLAPKKQNIGGAQLAKIKRKYSITMTSVFIPVIIIVFLISLQEERLGEKFFLLIVPFVCGISFFDGVFALTTNVYPLHVMERIVLYWHDTNKTGRKVAISQAGIALVLSVMSLIFYLI